MRLLSTFILFLFIEVSYAQDCSISLKGQVKDRHENSALPFSTVTIEETGRILVTDTAGFFFVNNLCEGPYHLVVNHIGCAPEQYFIDLTKDTFLLAEMEHHSTYLEPFTVEKNSDKSATETKQVISGQELTREAGGNLSKIIESITGVSTIKNGSGISKPVIHGLSGNRVTIINNGLVQAGQQWGNDHAPEVDPFIAKSITVVKGVDALEYGGNGLGGMVIIDPGTIGSDPHLHGNVHYLYRTNGRGNSAAVQLEQANDWFKWRFTGSGKEIGDRQSPDYFLTNTGNKESNFSLQLEKNIGNKWFNKLYYSYFQTELGVLRGSHIGNLTDLEQAINRDEPFFTKNEHSDEIEAPRQEVRHQLTKISSKYFLTDHHSIEWVGGIQRNERKEFDVRRGGRSNIPALDLFLESFFSELNFSHNKDQWSYKGGLQLRYNENKNDPATGILPLIPDYQHTNAGAYLRIKRLTDKFNYEAGGRFDIMQYDVQNITRTIPRVFENNNHDFRNMTLSGGISYNTGIRWYTTLNTGWMQRSPEMNEMYSFGLHQGVSGIEEGNTDLKAERAWKTVWSNTYRLTEKLELRATTYFQYISDYIYLQPEEMFRLTIRGAFPVFSYQQTDATIHGWDIGSTYEFLEHLQWSLKYAAVRGRDREQNAPLVYMPADNFSSTIRYNVHGKKAFRLKSVALTGNYVLEQTRLNDDQDFLSPPSDYFLMGAQVEAYWRVKKSAVHFSLKIENLLDRAYRDYLNRLRYYADEEGRNVIIGARFEF